MKVEKSIVSMEGQLTTRTSDRRGSIRTESLFTSGAPYLLPVPRRWPESRDMSEAAVTPSQHNELRVRFQRALRAKERTRWS